MKKRKKRLQCLISFTIIINMTFINVRSISAANNLRVAKIKSFSGTVKINKAGGEKTFKAVEGMSLVEGDSITTEKNSSITLYIDDDKEVKIGDNSMVNLSQLSGYIESDDEQTGISLWVGKIWSNVKKKLKIREKYEIKVPTAVMGVRGTEFSVESDAESKIEVAVLEGVVTAIKSIPQDSAGGNVGDNTFEITITKNEKALMNQQDKSDKDIIIKNVQATNLSVFVLEILKDYNAANPGSVDSNIVKDIDNAIKQKISAAPVEEYENIEAPKIEMDHNVATGQEKVTSPYNLPAEVPPTQEQGSITETIEVVTDTTQADMDITQTDLETTDKVLEEVIPAQVVPGEVIPEKVVPDQVVPREVIPEEVVSDQVQDQIPAPASISTVEVVEVSHLALVKVDNGTTKEDVVETLPSVVTLNLSDGTKKEVPVIKWDSRTYDGNKAGEYMFTAVYNLPTGVTAIVPEVTTKVIVTATVSDTEPVSPVQVNNGTTKGDAIPKLPSVVILNLSDGTKKEVPVTWDSATYDETKAGEYIFTAKYDLPTEIIGTVPEVTATLIVLEPIPKPVTVLDVEPVYPVQVNNGVSEEVVVAELPSKITLNLNDGTKQEVTVIKWNCEKYEENTAGGYTFTAEYDLPDGVMGNGQPVTATVIVLESIPKPVTVLDVEPVSSVQVINGLSKVYAVTELPSMVTLNLSDGTKQEVPVTWDCANYDGNIAGEYTFIAEYSLPDGVIGSVPAVVTVLEDGARTILSVNPVRHVVVQKGTIQSYIELPSRIGLYLSDGTYEYVNANWSCENYDGNIAGRYVFTALYTLPNRIIGSGLTVNTIVTVLETNIGSATGESVTTVDKIVEP